VDLVNNANNMALDPTEQVRAVSSVAKAVAVDVLSIWVEIDAQEDMLDLKRMVNTIVTWLNSEVTRLTMEVGTTGILIGQAAVDGVQNTLGDLTDYVDVDIPLDLNESDTREKSRA
jgi:uncharacterized protein YdaL